MFYRVTFIVILALNFANANYDIKNLKSFKADFIQKIESFSNKTIEYKGKVFIKNSGKILWKYKEPIKKNVYIIKDFVIVDEPELEQAIFTKLESDINIIKLLNNSQKINQNTYIAKIDEISYLIETKNNKINTIKYKDKLDNKISIVFLKVIQNSNIDDKIFEFIAPKDYDIIRK